MKRELQVALSGALLAMGTAVVTPTYAACKDCGAVVDVKTIEQKGEASGAGRWAGLVRFE